MSGLCNRSKAVLLYFLLWEIFRKVFAGSWENNRMHFYITSFKTRVAIKGAIVCSCYNGNDNRKLSHRCSIILNVAINGYYGLLWIMTKYDESVFFVLNWTTAMVWKEWNTPGRAVTGKEAACCEYKTFSRKGYGTLEQEIPGQWPLITSSATSNFERCDHCGCVIPHLACCMSWESQVQSAVM